MPNVSVIMLTYNREMFVRGAIKSVLEQTYDDFELILVDNGSTDSSGKVCDEMAETDSRIRVIHKSKGNIGSGRNAGLRVAKGKYIAFVDDDDYCYPDFLEFLFNLAESEDADIAVCGSYKEEEGQRIPNGGYMFEEKYLFNAAEAIEKYLWRQLYNCAMPTKLLRRELFDKIQFSDEGTYDDICTTYKYFANANKIAVYGLPKYVFYRHPGNNSSAATKHHLLNPKQLEEYLKAFRERTEYISKVLPSMRELARYSEWSYMISMIEKIERFQLNDCSQIEKFMKKEILDNLREFQECGYVLEFEKEWLKRYVLDETKFGNRRNGK